MSCIDFASSGPRRAPGVKSQGGVTSIEYALLASLIALAIVAGVSATGTENGLSWDHWAGKVLGALHL